MPRGAGRLLLRALLAALCLAASLAALPPDAPTRADGPQPVRVTQDAAEDRAPQVAVDAAGRAAVVWLRVAGAGAATLQRAAGPLWMPTLLAEAASPPAAAAAPPFHLTPGPAPYVAWPQPVSGSTALYVADLATGEAAPHLLAARPPAWTYAVDASGRPHAAWAEGNAVYYWAQGQPVVLAARTASAARVSDVSLALTPAGAAYLSWTGWNAADRPTGVYVGDSRGDRPAVLVAAFAAADAAPAAQGSRLLALGEEELLLAWLAADGLRAATSADWRAAALVAPGVADWADLALAAGSGAAHAVWYREGRLWHAHSADWAGSRRSLGVLAADALAVPPTGLDLAVGTDGALHLAWSAGGATEAEIYYLRVERPAPALVVAAPQGGEAVGPGLTARAVSAPAGPSAAGAASEWVEVAFWAEEAPVAGTEDAALGVGYLLHSLGVDRDAADGWSAHVEGLPFATPTTLRVVAMGTDAAGRVGRAEGAWFTYSPAGAPRVWLEPPAGAPLRGEATVGVLAPPAEGAGPVSAASAPTEAGSVALAIKDAAGEGPAVTIGEVVQPPADRWPQVGWERLPFDTRRLADGEQRVVASFPGAAAPPESLGPGLVVENALAPTVRVTSPTHGQVLTGTVAVHAEAQDLDGRVERVEFYLARAAVDGGPGDLPAPPAERLWLGSDADGSDGWGAERPIEGALDGDGWTAWAVAYDDRGLSTAASAGPLSLLARPRPVVRLAVPSAGSVLRGTHPVTLHALEGYPYLASARLYVQDAVGAGWALGALREEDGRWVALWDTTAQPDGEYRLLIVGEDVAGAPLHVAGGPVRVANDTPLLRFADLEEGGEVRGRAAVRFTVPPRGPALATVRLYRREVDGALTLLGEDLSAADGWAVVWDTPATPDGPCDLVALGEGADGAVARAERRVRVRNVAPAVGGLVALPTPGGEGEGPGDAALAGQVAVRWEATVAGGSAVDDPAVGDPPPAAARDTRLEYSPDGGRHWLLVADGLGERTAYSWDTRRFPDARAGILRVTVEAAGHAATAALGPLRVNNTNERPHVTLLTPRADLPVGGAVHVAWAADDPDDDALTTRLEYRVGQGPWLPLPGAGVEADRYTWDTSDLAARADYALRITVEDAAGAVATDTVEGLEIVRNAPPVVRFVGPRGEEPLRGEAIVLWSTEDADGDALVVDLYYSDNAGQTWLPLAEGLSDTGFYLWQFSFLPSGAAYRLRVVARDAYTSAADQSGLLRIDPQPAPRVTVHSPTSGQAIRGWFPVTWSVSPGGHAGRRMSVVVRREGDDWQPLGSDLVDSGLLLWDTAAFPDGAYELAVLATHPEGAMARSATRTLAVHNRTNRPPTARLLSPLGGETWGGLREVRWEAADPDGDALTGTLSASADAGRTWQDLATLDARAGLYLWDTARRPDGGDWLLRLVVTDGEAVATATTPGTLRLANARVRPPAVAFLAPDGEGRLGPERVVRWEATDPDGDPLTVALDLSVDGGAHWEEVARGGAAGEYSLGTLAAGLPYRLRLRASDGLYETAALSVPLAPEADDPPALEVEAEGTWAGLREVRWRVTHPVDREMAPVDREMAIDLDLSADGGRTWTPVVEGFPNTGVYDLDTTEWPNGAYRLRVTARLGAQAPGEALAAVGGPLEIANPGGHAPVVSLVTPRGGEVWAGAREVRWHTHDPDGDALTATLLVSLDHGATWAALAEGLAATSYVWDTAAAPNCAHALLRVVVSDGRFGVQDTSAPLAIANPDRPAVALAAPAGDRWTGLQRLAWHTRGPEAPGARVHLEVTLDGGRTWRPIAAGLPLRGELWWDAGSVPEGARLTLRARLAGDEDLALDVLPRTVTASGPRE